MKTRVAIVDDHKLLAESLTHALGSNSSIEVVGTFSNARTCLDALSDGIDVDVLMSDYSMPDMNGIELCALAKSKHPHITCILLTMHDATELRYRARRAGIDGFVVKTTSISEIQQYVINIAEGELVEEYTNVLVESFKPESVVLTPSEIEVVRCIVCLEMSSKEAAEHLFRSHHTVEQHRKNIHAKLGIDSVAALTKYAIEAGICTSTNPS